MKNRKLRIVFAYFISILPINKVRCFLYRLIFKYEIYQSNIGWKTIIAVDSAKLIECHIGNKNKFIGPMNILINKNAKIGSENIFECGLFTIEKQLNNNIKYERQLIIEHNARIAKSHYIDIAGSFILKKNSWIAGRGSQFWTHGAGVLDRNILIEENCYIGSAVRFIPGSSVGKNNLIGMGSVITKKFNSENVMIAGQPAKILKENYDWRTRKIIT